MKDVVACAAYLHPAMTRYHDQAGSWKFLKDLLDFHNCPVLKGRKVAKESPKEVWSDHDIKFILSYLYSCESDILYSFFIDYPLHCWL